MKMLKRTYALPPDTLVRFEQAVEPGQRSVVVARLMAGWLTMREREALRSDIEEGCREMWDVYLETAREWEPLEAEVDRMNEETMARVEEALKIATGLTMI